MVKPLDPKSSASADSATPTSTTIFNSTVGDANRQSVAEVSNNTGVRLRRQYGVLHCIPRNTAAS